jgi:hypothetical protein
MERIEYTAQILAILRGLGPVRELSAEQVDAIHARFGLA